MNSTDTLRKGVINLDDLTRKVNNIGVGLHPHHFKLSEWVSKPYITIPVVFLGSLLLLWLLDFGVIKDKENKVSVGRLFLYTVILSLIIWLPLWFFYLRKLS